jgi:acyl-CoA-binding protein
VLRKDRSLGLQVQCQAPYPDKYYKAHDFYQSWPAAARQPRQDTLLLLFALSSQVEHGPCKEPKPSAWDSATHAKWYAWSGLQNMPGNEAMRLFVKTLEEDEP